jgi:EAL domain-containing protein (putative c-di-GMP-specific phosphodiesterase class I)
MITLLFAMLRSSPEGRVFRWYLESLVEGGRQLRRITVYPFPFRVGRLPGLSLTLSSDSVSKEHAELFLEDGQLRVFDLSSKNGTFVNGERVEQSHLHEGDILHIAQVEYRLGRQEIEGGDEHTIDAPTRKVTLSNVGLPQQFVEGVRELPQLLEERMVTALFQPIMSLPSGAVAGYEALGRGRHPRLPEPPLELFRIAAGAGESAVADLSRVFREKALELVEARPSLRALFLNIHPAELEQPNLVDAIVGAQKQASRFRLTLEVPEGALDDIEAVEHLRTLLSRSGVGLAYDDFGAGQARLLELAQVPPHYLKFDMSLVRGIDSAPRERRRLLTSLVSVARDLLVYTVAEGVETAEEADVCMRIGFTHAQGLYFGRPGSGRPPRPPPPPRRFETA